METIKTINTDLAALHGYLCADGYVTTNTVGAKHKFYRMGLRNTEKALLEDFQSKFYSVFGLKPIITAEGDRAYKSSKEAYALLTNTFGSFYCREWAFPAIFSNSELKTVWLRAMFDCEGYVIVRKGIDRLVGIEMVNFKGLQSVKSLLQEFGIKSKFRIKKNGKLFALYIFGKENLILFSKRIGFLHPKKRRKLQKGIKSYQNPFWGFPKEKASLNKFVLKKLKGKSGKIGERRIVVCSSLRTNLEKLQLYLDELFGVRCLISKKLFNGIGNPYFELSINAQNDVKKIHLLASSKYQSLLLP